MKYLSFLLASILVFSAHSMENKKTRRDCCYLAHLTKNIVSNLPAATAYTVAEYTADATIYSLAKLQKMIELPQDTKQKME